MSYCINRAVSISSDPFDPTFWTHDTLGQPIYDWLNCMGSSAAALLELDDATNAR